MKHVVIAGSFFFHVKAVYYKKSVQADKSWSNASKESLRTRSIQVSQSWYSFVYGGKITGNMFDHSIQTDFVSVVSDPESFQIGSIHKVCWMVRSGKLPNRSDPGRCLTGKCCNLKSSCSAPGQWMVNVNKVKHSEECQHSLKFICDFIMFIEIALWYNCQVLADVGERISLFKIVEINIKIAWPSPSIMSCVEMCLIEYLILTTYQDIFLVMSSPSIILCVEMCLIEYLT